MLSANYWQRSLKTRVTLITLVIFLAGICSLSLYASRMLHADMKRMLGEQQYSAVSYTARSINEDLEKRVVILQKIAGAIGSAQFQKPEEIQKFLSGRYAIRTVFNAGVFIVTPDEIVIGDNSDFTGRIGTRYSGDDAIQTALIRDKTTIGRPALGRFLNHPGFNIATPIHNTNGKVIGALVGATDLSMPSFLDVISGSRYGLSGAYQIIAPQHGIFVTATDKSHMLQPLPAPGTSLMLDRYRQGYEGFGIGINAHGVEELSAGKRIPASGWYVVTALPTEEAFSPAHAMLRHMSLATIALMLVVGALIWWMIKHQLAPMQLAAKKLANLSEKKQPLQNLPVSLPDEIGQLVGGFNRLIELLVKRDSELKESESRFRQQFERHSAPMLLIDAESGEIIDANPAAAKFYGYTLAQMHSMRIDKINTQPKEEINRERLQALREQRNYFVFKHRLSNDEIRVVEVHSSPIWFNGKNILFSIVHDITQRINTSNALILQLKFSHALNRIAESILRKNDSTVLLQDACNIVGETLAVDRALIYKVSPEENQLIGLGEWLNPQHPDITPTNATYPLDIFIGGATEIQRTRQWITSQADNINPHFLEDGSGEILHRQMKIRSLLWYPFAFNKNEFYAVVLNQIHADREWTKETLDFLASVSHQISIAINQMLLANEHQKAEQQVQHLANFDPLTGLPNRSKLDERINYTISLKKRNGGQLAMMFLDLDHFKNINDTLGHGVGDALLVQVASRLKATVREGDTISRQGGDEFILFFPEIDVHGSEYIAEKLLEAFSQPYRIENHNLTVTPSIGIALYPNDGSDFETLAKNADIAMYQAKNAGRNTMRFFDPTMQTTVMARVTLEADLRHAILEQEQLQLYYQLQVESSGHITGAEALIRWIHPERGMISPAEFIPLAEETGLILPLGHWIMSTACQQLAEWAAQPASAHLTLAVNVSARQLRMPTFVEEVLMLVDHFKVNPARLKLEITEGMLLDNVDNIIEKMTRLKARGINFSMDDFGTGYSSLQYLKRLPLYQLKIDQSFVRDIATDNSDQTIVCTIIAMAQSLDLEIIAEGVETDEQREFLLDKGCTRYQGYLFAKPMPIEQLNMRINQKQA